MKSKSIIKSTSKDLYTAEEFFNSGKHYYRYATEMEDGEDIQGLEITEERINACWGFAASKFWMAFAMGSEKAPLWLFKCFAQGVGVLKDDYLAAVMFGVALKLNDPECKNIKVESQPKIHNYMNTQIDQIVNLIQKTHLSLPAEGIKLEIVNKQMNIFDKEITLPNGKSLYKCFYENKQSDTPAAVPLDHQHTDSTLAGHDSPIAKEGCEIS